MRRFRNHDPPHSAMSGSVVPLRRQRSPHHYQQQRTPYHAARPLVKSTGGSGILGGGPETSIVFLRKKTAQAVHIQSIVRGHIARQYYQRKLERHKKRLAKRLKKQRWNTAATCIQKYARRCLIQRFQKVLSRLRLEYKSAKLLQAVVRGYLKRSYYNSDMGKLELRLLQIQQQEQKELDLIEKNKFAQRKELDQTLRDLRLAQAERTAQQMQLEEEYNHQQTIIAALKKDNKKLRNKIDKMTEGKKEMKSKRRSLHFLEETADNFQSTLQDKIAELEASIEQTKIVETNCIKVHKRWQLKLDRVVDVLGSEKRQQYVYIKFMDRVLTKLEQKQNQQLKQKERLGSGSSSSTNYEQLFEACLAIAADE